MQDLVKQSAAFGGARIADQRLERREPEDAPRIDRVGVASQRLDLGDREMLRPHAERRPGLRAGGEILLLAGIERARPAKQRVAPPAKGRR
ncbi:hypothetical protein, partial [Mesorhizobium sp.]|uniref:hypothetical protein n=1 Tax=Mesorhizobium sp. TaxID=1871066 RepID=UPI0025C4E267